MPPRKQKETFFFKETQEVKKQAMDLAKSLTDKKIEEQTRHEQTMREIAIVEKELSNLWAKYNKMLKSLG